MKKGARYARLKLLDEPYNIFQGGKTRKVVQCTCDCGNTTIVSTYALRKGTTKSCGCIRAENTRSMHTTHGLAKKVPEYYIWKTMRQRCNNPKQVKYPRYGGRGITVCPEWNDFAVFYSEMGPRPTPKHTIEREDNDLGYCKSNCKWATKFEQACNTSTNIFLKFRGETLTISQWTRKLGFPINTIYGRIASGWSINRALTEPVHIEKRKHNK